MCQIGIPDSRLDSSLNFRRLWVLLYISAPLCWDEVGEHKIDDVKLIEVTSKNIRIIRDRLMVAQDRHKIYADTRKRELEFDLGDMVFLKIAHWKRVIQF